MNAETKATVLEALRHYRAMFSDEYKEWREINAAIADVEANAWEPLADGVYWNDIRTRGIAIEGNGKWLTTFHDSDEGCKVDLHDNVLLMRRTTTAQQPAPSVSVPDDVREAMRNVVDGYWIQEISRDAVATIEAWLEQGGE